MYIAGLNKTTLLDYPKHLAATIFFSGCDFCCPFCHNASLVMNPNGQPKLSTNEVLEYLKKRSGILEGVCITGGEPTLQSELIPFLQQLKLLNLKIKLDTNGNHPDIVSNLLRQQLLDYIAMDIKNSPEHYANSIGIPHFDCSNVKKSVSLIMHSGIDYEFRTTVVRELHTLPDFLAIGSWLKGAKAYYLQSYKDSGDIICPEFTACSKEEMESFARVVSSSVPSVRLRGID